MPRNFAIRLRCPQGDCDSWVTLLNREESLEQILEQTWDFKCHEHGPQNSVPQEAMEVAPLDNPEPSPTPISYAVFCLKKKTYRSRPPLTLDRPMRSAYALFRLLSSQPMLPTTQPSRL